MSLVFVYTWIQYPLFTWVAIQKIFIKIPFEILIPLHTSDDSNLLAIFLLQ